MGNPRHRTLPVILAVLVSLLVAVAAPGQGAPVVLGSLASSRSLTAPAASSLAASVEDPPPSRADSAADPDLARPYFGARYYAQKVGRFTTVDPVYNWNEHLLDPQRWNRYAYVRNNPLRYVDPDGRALDVLVDAGLVAYDVFDIGRSVYRGEGVNLTQGLALGGDIIGAVIPFATGIGPGIRAARAVDKTGDAARALKRGRESEVRVLDALGETKNTAKVKGCEGCSIPDYQNATTIGEVKDAARVDNTRQIRIQREAAEKSGREHVIQAGTNAQVSKNVQRGPTRVERRPDLGPQ